MRTLGRRVHAFDCAQWSADFLTTLDQAKRGRFQRMSPTELVDELEWTLDSRKAH